MTSTHTHASNAPPNRSWRLSYAEATSKRSPGNAPRAWSMPLADASNAVTWNPRAAMRALRLPLPQPASSTLRMFGSALSRRTMRAAMNWSAHAASAESYSYWRALMTRDLMLLNPIRQTARRIGVGRALVRIHALRALTMRGAVDMLRAKSQYLGRILNAPP